MEEYFDDDDSYFNYEEDFSFIEDDYLCYDFSDNEANSDDNYADELMLDRKTTRENSKAVVLEHDVYEQSELKDILDTKILLLKGFASEIPINNGEFWNILRNNSFFVNTSKNKLQDSILDLCQTKFNQKSEKIDEGEFCMVCYEELNSDKNNLYHIGCLHYFCQDCMIEHIKQQISEGPNCLLMKCPYEDCQYMIYDDYISQFLSETSGSNEKSYKMYKRFLLEDFVGRSPNMNYCCDKTCEKVLSIDHKFLSKNMNKPPKDVFCQCNTLVCLKCSGYGHEPLSCEYKEYWNEIT